MAMTTKAASGPLRSAPTSVSPLRTSDGARSVFRSGWSQREWPAPEMSREMA